MDLFQNPEWPWLKSRVALLVRAGSNAYGTATAESDMDVRGIAIPPLDHFFGIDQEPFKQAEQDADRKSGNADVVIYGIQKFIRIAASGNPAAMEVLFSDQADHLIVHPIGAKLLGHGRWFLSRKTAAAFLGAAGSQYTNVLHSRERLWADKAKQQRINAYGYDTKVAMHGLRWLRMAKEVLSDQGVIVRRPDAEELLRLRNGDWCWRDFVIAYGNLLNEVEVLLRDTKLPERADLKAINRLCTDLVQSSFDHHVRVPVMATGFDHQVWSFGIGNLEPKTLSEESEN